MTTVMISEALGEAEVRSVRALLDRAFRGEFAEEDWFHAVGGRHVTVDHDGVIVAHAAVVRRTIRFGSAEHEVGYVEAVATDPDVQRRGHGTAAMRAVGGIVREHHGVGLLSTGAHGFYERLGWRPWRGPTRVRRADGTVVATPDDDGGIMVLVADDSVLIDLHAAITCDDRPGDPW